jgi:hypothetical protein
LINGFIAAIAPSTRASVGSGEERSSCASDRAIEPSSVTISDRADAGEPPACVDA